MDESVPLTPIAPIDTATAQKWDAALHLDRTRGHERVAPIVDRRFDLAMRNRKPSNGATDLAIKSLFLLGHAAELPRLHVR